MKAPPREYSDTWFTKALEFFDTYEFSRDKGRLDNASFQLHQCVERLYQTVLLVKTFYTPYIHAIVKLRVQAELVDARLRDAWPREKLQDVDAFEKLQEAYVKVRYIKDFEIAADQLEWVGARTATLIELESELRRADRRARKVRPLERYAVGDSTPMTFRRLIPHARRRNQTKILSRRQFRGRSAIRRRR